MKHVQRIARRLKARYPDKTQSSWRLFFGVEAVLAIVYFLLPYGRLASALYIFATAFAAGSIFLAVLSRRHLFSRLAWGLIAGALTLGATGHGIWYWLDLHGLEPFPSIADVFYLAVYPLFGIALWQIGRHGREVEALGDALIVGISAAVLAWALLIAPYSYDPDLTPGQLLVSAGYPVADLILLPLILRLVFLQRACIQAHFLLLVGMLAYLLADIFYAQGNATGGYAPGGLVDSLWLVAYALFMAAAWHPSARIVPRHPGCDAELSMHRLYVLGTASVLVPMVTLFAADSEREVVRVAAIGSIFLFLLVMWRMAGLLKRTHHQARTLETLASTDPLTGAANRRHLEQQLTKEMARAERNGSSLGLAFLDLDCFKRFNDTHGHSAGDALLQELVAGWQDTLRAQDLLARFGGEEFVVLLPDTATSRCLVVLERLRSCVPLGQTCSAGLALYHPGETADALIGRADDALYAAKHGGRDRVVLATAGL
ncbi:MAG: diguanylate cyclase domain-containing protein [Pseudomonadota bacterium]